MAKQFTAERTGLISLLRSLVSLESGTCNNMSLESCPTCGHALSIVGAHCRHCVQSIRDTAPFKRFDLKLVLPAIVAAAVGLIMLLYAIFAR